MTTLDTKHLRELAEAATPGPWAAGETTDWDGTPQASVNSSATPITWDDHSGEVFKPGDASYIAAIDPPTLITLLDELERLRGETEWEYVAAARKGYVSGEPRIHVRGAIQAYEEELDQAVFEQEDETPVVFKRRAAGPWEPVEGDTPARHARDSGA